MQKKYLQDFMFRVLCGFFLGVSIIAPGVSGSIMAIMMGVYHNLIDIISNPFKNFKKNFFYLLPMGIGGLISLGVFLKLLAFSFEQYPVQSKLLFMGLIAGSLIEVYHQIRKVSFKWHYLIGFIVTFGIAVAFGVMLHTENAISGDQISLWYICLAGLAAGIASMIPGVSISLILMLFGVYNYLLNTVSGLTSDISQIVFVIIPVGICFLVGMILFSNVIKFAFSRYPGFAYFMVFGFTFGTMIAIFPDTPPTTIIGWIMCGVLFVIGLGISIGFQFLGKKFNTETENSSDIKSPDSQNSIAE